MDNRAALTTIFVLLLALFISLGMWQLRRAEDRAEVHERFAEDGDLPALTGPVESGQLDAYRYRRLELHGKYLSSRQLLLDSMTHEGRVGYHVLTPFLPLGDSRWILVNRGWVEADPDRRVLPLVEVGEAVRLLRGRVDALPQPGLTLGGSGGSDAWPQVLLFPTFDDVETRFPEPLYHYQLLLDAELPDGFVREWQPRVLSPERHIGYAIQWFSFAGVLAVMAIVLSVRSRRLRGG